MARRYIPQPPRVGSTSPAFREHVETLLAPYVLAGVTLKRAQAKLREEHGLHIPYRTLRNRVRDIRARLQTLRNISDRLLSQAEVMLDKLQADGAMPPTWEELTELLELVAELRGVRLRTKRRGKPKGWDDLL